MDEVDGHWVEHEDPDCPICQGRISPEFLAHLDAIAADPGPMMEGEEFWAWLNGLIERDQ